MAIDIYTEHGQEIFCLPELCDEYEEGEPAP